MLRGENLGRRHERRLVSALDSNDRRLEGHDGLARADVALQQTAHRDRLAHVVDDLLQDLLLCSRRMEWQDLLDRRTDAVVDREGDAWDGAHLAALKLQPE